MENKTLQLSNKLLELKVKHEYNPLTMRIDIELSNKQYFIEEREDEFMYMVDAKNEQSIDSSSKVGGMLGIIVNLMNAGKPTNRAYNKEAN